MSVAVKSTASVSADPAAPIRVMIVDDSIVVRGLIKQWIASERDLEIVASCRSGRQAVEQIETADPDVVVLDVEMPDLDGIAALPLLLKKKRNLAVIMASTLTRRNAEVTLKALSLGALDCVAKPEIATAEGPAIFQRELLTKVREFGIRMRARRDAPRPVPTPAPAETQPSQRASIAAPSLVPTSAHDCEFSLRAMPRVPPRVLLIGASTGGPQALNMLLGQLGRVLDRAPVLITQHMPPTFTTILAEHLQRASGRMVREAEDGEPVVAGQIYVAPGGQHMRVVRRGGDAVIALDDGPLVHFCKPAVDPLFSSAAQVWGQWVLGLILTGMGTDGTHGAADVVAAGGTVIAQDEATSVVWGMPGSAAEAGLCAAVLALDEIGPKVVQLFRGERS